MKFKDTELLPGVIIDCDDPKKLGRVKATVPTLFDESQMQKEGMPWIYPLTMHGYQGFSKLQEGSKIWVFKQENNYREFWYLPMFEMNQDTREIISEYEEPDVIISRNAGTNSVYIYYTDQQGIMLKVGENSLINIKGDEIDIKSGDGNVVIKGGKVYIGNDNPTEQAILGNKLDNVLSKLASDLLTTASAGMANPYTNPMATQLQTAASTFQQSLGDNILCKSTIVS